MMVGGPDGVRDLQRMDRVVFSPIVIFCCLETVIIFLRLLNVVIS